jgi:uncharacterized protein (TIGR02246 family)
MKQLVNNAHQTTSLIRKEETMGIRQLVMALMVVMFALTARPAFADETKGDPKDKEAIAKNGEAFIEAFHKGDADALAAFWTADGDYTEQTGRHMKGREEIAKAYKALFSQHKDLKLRIDSLSLRFVTPDVAIEDGTTEVFQPSGGPPSRARYTIVHTKNDGQWYLSSVRDAAVAAAANHEHLQALEWAIGDWEEEGDKGEIERLSVSWTENENFIIANFATTLGDSSIGSATQWIGWDPLAKRVRSWIFDAAGGFGEGSWTTNEKKCVIKTTSVTQDGKKATATYVVTAVDPDIITLQAKDRSVDGSALPDTKEAKLKRVK